jgi:putative transcriptional regulator
MSRVKADMAMNAGHPSEELLVDHVFGTLSAAAGLVVSAHLDTCSVCRHAAGMLNEVGCALILSSADMDLGDAAEPLIKAAAAAPESGEIHHVAANVGDVRLPSGLPSATLAPPRRFPGGMSITHIRLPESKPWRAFLLALPGGGRLPRHGHTGSELVCVLKGGFADGEATYAAGDFIETREGDGEHELEVVGDEACICLVALDGPIRWRGAMRAIRPFVGF